MKKKLQTTVITQNSQINHRVSVILIYCTIRNLLTFPLNNSRINQLQYEPIPAIYDLLKKKKVPAS